MKSEKLKKAWRYIGILRLCARRGIWLRRWQRRYILGKMPYLPPCVGGITDAEKGE